MLNRSSILPFGFVQVGSAQVISALLLNLIAPTPFALPALAHIPAAPAAGTLQNFDVPGTGTPYVAGLHVGTTLPGLVPGGPSQNGQAMRLAFATPVPTHTSIAFTRTHIGAPEQIVVDFDFRITPGAGRADGLGFAFLSTTPYGIGGAASPATPPYAGEEPTD